MQVTIYKVNWSDFRMKPFGGGEVEQHFFKYFSIPLLYSKDKNDHEESSDLGFRLSLRDSS